MINKKRVVERNIKVEEAWDNLAKIRKRLEKRNAKLSNKLGVPRGYEIGNKEYKVSKNPYERLGEIRRSIRGRNQEKSNSFTKSENSKVI